jgi:hypothetical protein
MDTYSRAVLTIIAICLVWVVLRDIPLVRKATAETPMYRGGTVPVTIRGIDECAGCRWEPLPVVVR